MSLAPVSGVGDVIDAVRDARARGEVLRIAGSGTWLNAGRHVAAHARLDLAGLAGIVAYEPGDLTLTARAGTPLEAIDLATAEHGQWLTLDPPGSRRGTIGATVATASAGPLASAFGTPRDHLLGCEFVSGAGAVVRAGGRVVKNVAGFDLARLVTGAWGTLGALTEVTMRLRARPQVDRTFIVRASSPGIVDLAAAAWRWQRSSDFQPISLELVSPSLANRLSLAGGPFVLVRVAGNEAYVAGAASSVTSLGECDEVDGSVWTRLARSESGDDMVFRASTRSSRSGALWARAVELAEGAGGFVHATIARGVVRCIVPPPATAAAVATWRGELRAISMDATLIGERLPAPLWDSMSRSLAPSPLHAGVRAAFDPDRVMNAGILGET